MYDLLMIFAAIIGIVLIIAVLLQASKGGGLAGTFGGGGAFGSVFGTRRTADFLSKTTWWLGGMLLVIALVVNLFFLKGKAENTNSIIQDSQQKTSAPAVPSLPVQK